MGFYFCLRESSIPELEEKHKLSKGPSCLSDVDFYPMRSLMMTPPIVDQFKEFIMSYPTFFMMKL